MNPFKGWQINHDQVAQHPDLGHPIGDVVKKKKINSTGTGSPTRLINHKI